MSMAVGYAMNKRKGKANCYAHGTPDCGVCMADGGMVEEEEASGYGSEPRVKDVRGYEHEEENQGDAGEMGEDRDIVERIMHRMMSKGGMVADETDMDADFEDNQFDDLVKDDELEGERPGSQEIGDKREDMDRHDIVARIMRQRGMKSGRLPGTIAHAVGR